MVKSFLVVTILRAMQQAHATHATAQHRRLLWLHRRGAVFRGGGLGDAGAARGGVPPDAAVGVQPTQALVSVCLPSVHTADAARLSNGMVSEHSFGTSYRHPNSFL